jgi:hypothetical protein
MDDPEISLRHYIERIIDEREKLYNVRFDAIDQHTKRALEALTEERHSKEWSAGLILTMLMAVLSIAISVFALFRR